MLSRWHYYIDYIVQNCLDDIYWKYSLNFFDINNYWGLRYLQIIFLLPQKMQEMHDKTRHEGSSDKHTKHIWGQHLTEDIIERRKKFKCWSISFSLNYLMSLFPFLSFFSSITKTKPILYIEYRVTSKESPHLISYWKYYGILPPSLLLFFI